MESKVRAKTLCSPRSGGNGSDFGASRSGGLFKRGIRRADKARLWLGCAGSSIVPLHPAHGWASTVFEQLFYLPLTDAFTILWTAEEDELVRTLPTREAVRRTERTLSAVKARRRRLGVPDGRSQR